MNGLERILKDIKDDAQVECDKIINQAKQKAGNIINEANNQAQKNLSFEQEKLKVLENDLNNRSQSAAKLEKRRMVLSEKQKIISDIIAKAHKRILDMPDKEYFDVLMKIALKNINKGNGEIVFNTKDKKRLPQKFISDINIRAEKIGGKIILSDKTADIDGGFLLIYGGIEENCSFEAVFHSNFEEFRDMVNRTVFEIKNQS